MFCVSLVPLTLFFPESLNFAHRGFADLGAVQERNPRERRGCAVLNCCNRFRCASYPFVDISENMYLGPKKSAFMSKSVLQLLCNISMSCVLSMRKQTLIKGCIIDT
jgi:hypothetical protein